MVPHICQGFLRTTWCFQTEAGKAAASSCLFLLLTHICSLMPTLACSACAKKLITTGSSGGGAMGQSLAQSQRHLAGNLSILGSQ